MNTERALNFRFRPTKTVKKSSGFFAIFACVEIGTYSVLDFVVLVPLHYYKVIRGIVRAVSVFVMDSLIWIERATNHLFGDHAMLIKKTRTVFTNDLVAASGNVTALPVPMIRAILAANSSFLTASDERLAQLFKAGPTECLIPKSLVFLRGHVMDSAKMSMRNLHRADKATQLTFDSILEVSIHKTIIPLHCNVYNIGV